STHSRNTLGGMIGNNSCGTHSIMSEFYGPGPLTVDQVLELDVLTYRGERFTIGAMTETQLQDTIDKGGEKGRILRQLRELCDRDVVHLRLCFPDVVRAVSRINLDRLLPADGFYLAEGLVGSGCRCVAILGAKVQLMDSMAGRVLLVAGFEDAPTGGDA